MYGGTPSGIKVSIIDLKSAVSWVLVQLRILPVKLLTCRAIPSFKCVKFTRRLWWTRFFNSPLSQKSPGLTYGEQDGQVFRNVWLITLSLVKLCRRNIFTKSTMCGDGSSSVKVTESKHYRYCKLDTTKVWSILLDLLLVTLYATRPLRVTSSKKKDPRVNISVNLH